MADMQENNELKQENTRDKATNIAIVSQFKIGSILASSLRIFLKNTFVFICLGILASFQTVIDFFVKTSAEQDKQLLWAVWYACGIVITCMMGGPFSYAVYKILRGKVSSIGESIATGMLNMVPLFLLSLMFAGAWSVGSFTNLIDPEGNSLVIFVLLVLWIILCVILAIMWGLSIYICAIEGFGVIDSIKRSAFLTKGFRLKIFVLSLLFLCPLIILEFIRHNNSIVIDIVIGSIIIVFLTYYSVVCSNVYYNLRAIKECVQIDKLNSTFD